MSEDKAGGSFKSVLFAGILVTLPLLFTYFLLQFLFVKLDSQLSPLVTKLLILAGYDLPENFRIPGIGLFALVFVIFTIGLLARNIIGKSIINIYEGVLTRIPLLKNIYVGAKQVIETFGNSMGGSFNKVIMIEYPRLGIYALAFITSKSKGEVERRTGKEMMNIFLPTTPNPTSGFFLLVPTEDIIELDMSVEDGVKMIISGGLVTPSDKVTHNGNEKELTEGDDPQG